MTGTRKAVRFRIAPEEIACLRQRIQAELGSRVRDIELVPREQGLVMKGTSETYYGKQLAQEAYMATASYKLVANEIQVLRELVEVPSLES